MAFAPAVAAIQAKVASAVTFLPVAWESDEYAPPSAPWCLFEVVGGDNSIRGVGVPGSTVYQHDGLIRAFVHIPKGGGRAAALQLADAIGAALMRLDIPAPAAPDYVRTETPRVDEGVAVDQRGVYIVVAVTIPFVFWHRR